MASHIIIIMSENVNITVCVTLDGNIAIESHIIIIMSENVNITVCVTLDGNIAIEI